ncbi:MAG: L-Ala-D/L-Glu epimerase [Alphaproteobacteria bacterium]|nr:L-Ala-D/L-Glu epimerase [Alphaproteobacteria bacterium]MDP6818994.1 L-Ala-D/L-Glu epimerase [Alphaproteobacteria bacterium]
MRKLCARAQMWPMRGTFRISRGARTETPTVIAEIEEAGAIGKAECVPYPRYGESSDSVLAEIESVRPAVEDGMSIAALQDALPAGAARNALDCALWDLAAKQRGKRAWELAGIEPPPPVVSAMTLSLDTPQNMAEAARASAHLPLLKLKVTGDGDLERVTAVRGGAPDSRLIVDANEGWRPEMLDSLLPALAGLGVELVEQPLPADSDDILLGRRFAIPLCADEACHTRADLDRLQGRYPMINVKLDKSGGLSEALALVREARARGFQIMVGCMVGSSLAMAPALLLTPFAEYVDLDGPLLLARDCQPGLNYDGVTVHPPQAELWG